MSSVTLQFGSTRKRVSGKRRAYGVWGHPVAHSLSPRLHQAAFEAIGYAGQYDAYDVAPGELDDAVRAARRYAADGIWGGMNLTLPLKEAILPQLDTCDSLALTCGAVNTVVCRSSAGGVQLEGYNTDVFGILEALRENEISLKRARFAILGAGGAARAAFVAALQGEVAEIIVANRSLPNAQRLVDDVLGRWPGAVPAVRICSLDQTAAPWLAGVQVLFQATSLGLSPHDPAPVDLQSASSRLFVFESIYRPARTRLLEQAAQRQLRAINGVRLLLHQGARAFEMWTAHSAPLDVMWPALQEAP